MTPEPRSVKTPRPYDASRRREAAQRAQARILEVAEELFLRDGYAATTVAAVAAAAGVSVETIYKTFRGKPGLIRAIQRKGLAGTAVVPAPDRSDQISASDLAPRAILRHWADLTGEVMPRVAPIILLVRAAAGTDPDMGELLAEINDATTATHAPQCIPTGRTRRDPPGHHSRTGAGHHVRLHRPRTLRNPGHPATLAHRALHRLHLPRTRRRTSRRPSIMPDHRRRRVGRDTPGASGRSGRDPASWQADLRTELPFHVRVPTFTPTDRAADHSGHRKPSSPAAGDTSKFSTVAATLKGTDTDTRATVISMSHQRS